MNVGHKLSMMRFLSTFSEYNTMITLFCLEQYLGVNMRYWALERDSGTVMSYRDNNTRCRAFFIKLTLLQSAQMKLSNLLSDNF